MEALVKLVGGYFKIMAILFAGAVCYTVYEQIKLNHMDFFSSSTFYIMVIIFIVAVGGRILNDL